MRLTHHATPPPTEQRFSHRERCRLLPGPRPARGPGQFRTSRLSPPAAHHSGAPVMPHARDGRPHGARYQLVVVIALTALVVLVNASNAQAEPTQVLALAGSIDQVLTNIRTWVMGILASLATVFLSIGGVRYVMGGGDAGEIEKAKTAFKSAAIGYGLAALAPLVVTVLQGIVGA